MTTVRPALRVEIQRDLDNTSFGKNLFEIKIQDGDFLIKVNFLAKKQFHFCVKALKEPIGNRFHFVTFEAPGQWMLEVEEFQHETFAQARGRIHHWAKRIEDDYVAEDPGFDGLEELRRKIIEEFDASLIKEGERFTREEKESNDLRLDEMQEKIEAIYNEKHANQHQINLMRAQISKLKASIDILDKRTWMLAAANRVLNIFKEVRVAVSEVKALTKDFDNLLPELSNESPRELSVEQEESV